MLIFVNMFGVECWLLMNDECAAAVFMAALWNRAGHYIFALWFLSFFFLSFFLA